MDIQMALLSRVIHDEDIATVVNARITPEFFTDDKYRRVYEYLLDHWRKFGQPPDLAVVRAAFPSYDWPVQVQNIGYFIHGLRQRRKRAILTSTLSTAAGFLSASDDPRAMDALEETIREGLQSVRLETAPTFDAQYFQGGEAVMDWLDERADDPGYLRGISTGFHGIDYVTGGLQPEQLVVMIGLPKSMKSSTLLEMGRHISLAEKAVLFIGFEMSNIEQMDRLTSLYSGVGLNKLLHGTFTWRERQHVSDTFTALKEHKTPFVLSTDMDNAMTVSGIQAKIVEYQPQVVLVDAAYLMQSETPKVEQGSPAALTEIARELKKLAQSQRIPIVVTTQASETRSKGGLNATSAMYTQAWRQSADVMLGVERVEPDASDTDEVLVRFKVLASRSGPRGEAILAWNWSQGYVKEIDPNVFRQPVTGEDGDVS
jgi:replicative DNA helicase